MKNLRRSGDYIEMWHGAAGTPGKTAAQIHDDFRHGPVAYDSDIVKYYGRWRIEGYICAERTRRTNADRTPDSNLRVLVPKSAKFYAADPARFQRDRLEAELAVLVTGRLGCPERSAGSPAVR